MVEMRLQRGSPHPKACALSMAHPEPLPTPGSPPSVPSDPRPPSLYKSSGILDKNALIPNDSNDSPHLYEKQINEQTNNNA